MLFTCASSCALHLELTPNMKALAFIRAFKRFTARRGTPDINSFKLLNRLLSRNLCCVLEFDRIHIKIIVKLWRVETVLLKIESVINGRPSAYLSEDDLGDVLTPNHLMYGRNIRTKSNAVVPESIVQDFSKRYKYISKLVNDQWKRSSKVYLNELQQTATNVTKNWPFYNVISIRNSNVIKYNVILMSSKNVTTTNK